MPSPNNPDDVVDIALVDGRHLQINSVIADRVVGVDADGDPLVPLGDPGHSIHHDDGTEYLIPFPQGEPV